VPTSYIKDAISVEDKVNVLTLRLKHINFFTKQFIYQLISTSCLRFIWYVIHFRECIAASIHLSTPNLTSKLMFFNVISLILRLFKKSQLSLTKCEFCYMCLHVKLIVDSLIAYLKFLILHLSELSAKNTRKIRHSNKDPIPDLTH
jgi:hypothetical protein